MTGGMVRFEGAVRGSATLHDNLAASHPSLARGLVWCRECGHSQRVDPADCLGSGWPKHCGYTMTIDSPTETTALQEPETPR